MKWFIKCLRHYADFSGRARRREYWMFTLFNVIFMFVLAFLLALMAANRWHDETLPIALQLTCFSLLGLPAMAVSVRRLHDLGKSGWMVLIVLIPIIGSIWLLVLMMTGGQTGENRFGPDPKTSPETFPDRAKLTSAGVVTIVAASVALFSGLFAWLLPYDYYHYGFLTMPFIATLRSIVFPAAVLVAGISLVRSGERGRIQPALWILLIVCGWHGIEALLALPRMLGMLNIDGLFIARINAAYYFSYISHLLLSLPFALMAALLLFAPRNRDAVRGSAVAVMAAGGLCLAAWLLLIGNQAGVETPNDIVNLLGAFGTIGYMLLAWIFLSHKEESANK